MNTSNQMDCNLFVIGSGAAGRSAAVAAAWHGLKVIVVEKDTVVGRLDVDAGQSVL